MRQLYFLVLAASLAVATAGCEDFFEKNIEDKQVAVLSPLNNAVTPYFAVAFRWNAVNGATAYQLQAVSPSFENPLKLLYDTVVTSQGLTLSFNPGAYQWRIRALNSAYQTIYQTYSFSVETSTDLAKQQVLLKTPAENAYTNASAIAFAWDSVYSATGYLFEVRTAAGAVAYGPVTSTKKAYTFPDAASSLPALADGSYTWSVSASNWYSATPFAVRSVVVDRTAPAAPLLALPKDKDTLSVTNATFRWTRPVKAGSPIYDSLFVSTTTNMATAYIKGRYTDTTATASMATGIYYWSVRSFDLAGNSSGYSATNKLTVK